MIFWPKRNRYSYITPILLIFSHRLRQAYANVLVTITEGDAFTEQQLCVQGCLWGYNALPYSLNCGDPVVEECYCRSTLAPVASSDLTKCVNDRCTPTLDNGQRAVSLYDQYCATAHTTPATNPATTTVPVTSTPEPPSIVSVVVTITNPSSSSLTSASASAFQSISEFVRNSILIGIMVALHLSPLAG